MKQSVKLLITGTDKGNVTITFDSVEKINEYIQMFLDMRDDLAKKIEIEKQRKREERKKKRVQKKSNEKELEEAINKIVLSMQEFDKLSVKDKIKEILKDYDELDESSKKLFEPMIATIKKLSKVLK